MHCSKIQLKNFNLLHISAMLGFPIIFLINNPKIPSHTESMSHGIKPICGTQFTILKRKIDIWNVVCSAMCSARVGVQHIISINKITLKLVETFMATQQHIEGKYFCDMAKGRE
jgi:hypothetical protein